MNLSLILFLIPISIAMLYFLISIVGKAIINKGQKRFNEKALAREGGKFIENREGRRIEYFTYGSSAADAPVVINVHGSGLEAMFEMSMHRNICEELNVKGIAISLPGMGYTDMKIGRRVVDWPKEDLESVLETEGVKDFFITGHSQGTPHAMAAAYYFKDRCKGLGLNAPLLPIDVSQDIKIQTAIGSRVLLGTEQLQKPWMSWYFFLAYFLIDLFSPWLPLSYIFKTTPKLREDFDLVKRIKKSFKRGNIRGSIGNTWESARDVCFEWGFDPRLIETKNMCIWHAKDDAQCSSEMGAWLTQYYRQKNAIVNFKDEAQGFGHFTYYQGEFLDPKKSMVNALVEHLKSEILN